MKTFNLSWLSKAHVGGKVLKGTLAGVFLLIILISIFVSASRIQPAKASSLTIYIMPDGSINPSTANITTTDNVTYTFTSNNYLPIVVQRSNTTIEGAGHTLRPPGLNGFLLSGVSNVTIRNTTITNCRSGVFLYSSSDDVLSHNNFTANTYGIWLGSSSRNVLSGNNVAANYEGVVLDSSSDNNTLVGNNVTANSDDGIILEFSSGNVLSSNLMASNTYNFGVSGSALNDLVNHVDTSNFVDDKPVYYLMHQSNIVMSPATCPEGVGYLALVNCKNVTVQGLTLTKNVVGLTLANTTDSKITHNTVTANRGFGIALWYSSDNNTLSGNNVTASSWYGILLGSSSGNILSGNNIANDGYGTINGYGIYLNSASGNRIFHNDFLNNTQQAYVSNSTNTWDDGYPSGGNYWGNFNSTDLYNGPYRNITGSDGIGDTPYIINANNTDHYPLMGTFNTYLVPVPLHLPSNVTVISNSTITDFLTPISLENPKVLSISFNVTGKQGSTGFCRVSIPAVLMNGTYRVLVNGTEIPYTLLPCSNATVKYLYFTYKHSTEQVTILPEFQSLLILPLLMIITLLGAIAFKKRLNQN
jgi:parallel beta-helix repeat protein